MRAIEKNVLSLNHGVGRRNRYGFLRFFSRTENGALLVLKSYLVSGSFFLQNEEHLPTHEIQVPYFKGGTCEQFLEFIDKTQAVIVGQNLTEGPQKVAFMRMVLKGDALAHFAQFFVTAGNKTNATYEASIR